jgi:hypothetical protein
LKKKMIKSLPSFPLPMFFPTLPQFQRLPRQGHFQQIMISCPKDPSRI